jgi:hypothetical protein
VYAYHNFSQDFKATLHPILSQDKSFLSKFITKDFDPETASAIEEVVTTYAPSQEHSPSMMQSMLYSLEIIYGLAYEARVNGEVGEFGSESDWNLAKVCSCLSGFQ